MSKSNMLPVDRLGVVLAQIAELKREEKRLKERLIEWGLGAYEGDLYRATVSHVERAMLDMTAVRAKLSPQFIRANTNIIPVTTVRVVARNAIMILLAIVLIGISEIASAACYIHPATGICEPAVFVPRPFRDLSEESKSGASYESRSTMTITRGDGTKSTIKSTYRVY